MREWPWYGYVLLAVILFGFFYLVYYQPNSKKLEALREERISLEEEVRMLRVKEQQLNRIESELVSLNRVLKELEVIIPLQEEIYDILRKIQQLAFDSRINITKFTPEKDIDKEFYFEKPYAISVTGNYHNLAIFFDRLRRFSRLFYIEDFSIKNLRTQTETNTISADSTAKTLIFHEEASDQSDT